jgi:hypothetical protein
MHHFMREALEHFVPLHCGSDTDLKGLRAPFSIKRITSTLIATLILKPNLNIKRIRKSGTHDILGKESGGELDFSLAHSLGSADDINIH